MKLKYYLKRLSSIFREGKRYVHNSSFPVGHYYSPIVDLEEYKTWSLQQKNNGDLLDLEMNEAVQLELLNQFSEFKSETPDWKKNKTLRYRYDNKWYPSSDGIALYSILRTFKPQRIIEVGSGYSSALMLDVNDQFFSGNMNLTFIEPNPERLNSLLRKTDRSKTTIIEKMVQTVPLSTFESLESGDLLLIDSSHVAKTGSDVNFLFFQVLPVLKPGVIVHIHDVFYPFEYPEAWITGGRNWNEIYLLRAFLQNNKHYEILFFNHFMSEIHADKLRESIALQEVIDGSSIYIRKKIEKAIS